MKFLGFTEKELNEFSEFMVSDLAEKLKKRLLDDKTITREFKESL